MKKFLKKKLGNEKGMTLIELLAVIVILAIIAAIAIPAIGNIIENSRYSAVKSDATNVMSAANIYFTDNASATSVDTATLIADGFLDSAGKLPVAASAAVVSNANPLTITTTGNVAFSGTKAVKFTGATLSGITGDNTKGSTISSTTAHVINN